MVAGIRQRSSELAAQILSRNSSDLRLRNLSLHWIKTVVPDKRRTFNGWAQH